VHAFLASDRLDDGSSERLEAAARLLGAWRVEAAITPADVVGAADALAAWVASWWHGARWRRELPVAARLRAGTLVGGSADLVLELDGESEALAPQGAASGPPARRFVLIDHKTFPGGDEAALERAAGYGGQLGAYAFAIERAGGTVVAAYIHLPVLGLVVPVEPTALEHS
jgi:hypothetical protein